MGREVKSAAVAVEQYFAHFDADKYLTPEQQEKIHSTLACTRDGYKQFVINPRDITKLTKQW